MALVWDHSKNRWIDEKDLEKELGMPIKNKKEKKWHEQIFNKPEAFRDGYQPGDIVNTLAQTTSDVASTIVKGGWNAVKNTGMNIAGANYWLLDKTGILPGAYDAFTDIDRYNQDIAVASDIEKGLKKANQRSQTNSIMGDFSRQALESTTESAINATLSKASGLPIWQVNSLATGYRNEYVNALNNGATKEQATISGLTSGISEVLTEYLFSGFIKLPGTGSGIDTALGKATEKIGSQFLRTITQYGINIGGEAFEEVLSGFGSALGQSLTYLKDDIESGKIKFKDIYSLEDALENAGAGALSAMFGSANPQTIQNIRDGRNLVTGLTSTQQKYIDEIAQQRMVEAEKRNAKLNLIQKGKINQRTMTDFEKGRLADANKLQQVNLPGLNVKDMDLQQSAYKYGINPNSEAIVTIDTMLKNRDVIGKFDEDLFKGSNENSLWSRKNGVRYVVFNPNASTDVLLEELAIHELTHDLMSSENSKEVIDNQKIMDYVSTLDGYKEARKAVEEKYKEQTDKLKNDEEKVAYINEEIVADTLGKNIGSQEYIRRLIDDEPSIAKNIYNWVVNKIANSKGVKNEKAYWNNVKNNFEKAYNMEYQGKGKNTKYSIGGKKGIDNVDLTKNKEFTQYVEKAKSAYNEALNMAQKGYSKEEIRNITKWYQDKNGDWKFEFTDKDFNLKVEPKNIKVDKVYKLGDLVEHKFLNALYPEIMNYDVKFTQKKGQGSFYKNTKSIEINKDKLTQKNAKSSIEGTLIHEIQHAIQQIENFENGRSSKLSKKYYYESLGEAEATDTRNRMELEKKGRLNRENTPPLSFYEDAKHPGYDYYMENRGIIDKIKDSLYSFVTRGDVDEVSQENNEENQKQNRTLVDGRGLLDNSSFFNEETRYSLSDYQEYTNELNATLEKAKNLDEKFYNDLIAQQEEYRERHQLEYNILEETDSRPATNENINSDFFKEHRSEYDEKRGIKTSDGRVTVMHLQKGDNLAKLSFTEGKDIIWIDELYVKNQKQGYGSEIVNSIKKYAEENGKYVQAFKELSTAKGFWDKTLRNNTKYSLSEIKPIEKGSQEMWELSRKIQNETNLSGKFVSENGHLYRHNTDFNFDKGDFNDEKTEVKYVYRAVSQAEYDSIQKNGYIKSNQSMNIGYEVEQGLTVYKDNSPVFYLPDDGGYVLKIEVKPENGFFYDSDEYAKTSQPIPKEQIVEVNGKPINNTDIRYSLSAEDLKQKQLDIILKSNPVTDDYHTWIRSVDDIKTYEEALQEDLDGETQDLTPDFKKSDLEKALETGKMTVYSSYPIEQGIFVTPSKMEAQNYAGSGKVYSKEINLDDVAWIDTLQGQYARVQLSDIRNSQQNEGWQSFLDNNFKSKGTKTRLGDIKLPGLTNTIQEEVQKQTSNALLPIANELKELNKNLTKVMNPLEISQLTPQDANTTPILPGINRNKVGDGKSKFFDNIKDKTNMLSDETKTAILSSDDVKYYDKVTNKDSLDKAFARLQENGQAEVEDWLNKTKQTDGKDARQVTSVDVAEGWILLKQVNDAIEKETDPIRKHQLLQSSVNYAINLRDIGSKAGQVIQAFNILSRLTPEGMVYYAQKELSQAYDQMVQNKTKAWIDENKSKFELQPNEVQFILDTMREVSTMEDGYDKKFKLAQIQKVLTDKLPPAKGAGIKAWMRISMLFNPKTQVRNVAGNALIAPINAFGDMFASGVDKLVSAKTGVRTTGSTNWKNYAQGMKKGLYESYNDFKNGINTRNIEGNRFEVTEGKSFNDNNAIGKALNRVDSLLSFMLDAGDRGFYEASFVNSINNQMVLNNTTEVTQEMIDIATQEALSRTWQDNNEYTKFVLGIRNGLNTIFPTLGGYGVGDILIPFAKTPANLTKAIVEYSPVGLIGTINKGIKLNRSLTNGQYSAKTQHEFVQSLGKATAGTMLYILGIALANAGVTTGESDEDKDVSNFMKNTLGVNSYSIKIGDMSFTYDWAQPLTAPLAITANLVQKQKEEASLLENVVSTLDTAGNLLLEQSFMESISTVLNNNEGIATGMQEAILDLPARAIPTFLKQITDLTDGTQRQTFVKDKPIESMFNSMKAKIPGLSYTLDPSVDTLGREIQKYGGKNNLFNVFLNPANVSTENVSESAQEIYRLYKETGETNIMPRVAPYYVNKKGEKIVLDTKQRAEYQKVSGSIIENNVAKLLESTEYKNMSDKDKASVVNDIVNYSYNIAQNQVLGTELSKEYERAYEYSKIGDMSDYYAFTNSIDDKNADTKRESVFNYLYNSELDDNQIAALYSKYYSTEQKLDNLLALKIPMRQFIKFDTADIQGEYNPKTGQTISGSKKNAVIRYVNDLEGLSKAQKAIIIKSTKQFKFDNYNNDIIRYVNTLSGSVDEKKVWLKSIGFDNYDADVFNYINSQNISKEEKIKKLDELGFTVRNGRVYY